MADNFTQIYRATATGVALHNSDASIKMVEGPFGSGKSCMMVMDALYYAAAQPAVNGYRYCKIGVIRDTYGNLKSTTRTSLLEVFPSSCGSINKSQAPMEGHYSIPLKDGTVLIMDIECLAVQAAEDFKRLRSKNWTFAWINEADAISFDIFVEIMGRTGRYPSKAQGGCFYSGILMDFNPQHQRHWLNSIKNQKTLELSGKTFEIFYMQQPPAAFEVDNGDGTSRFEINPAAENLDNLAEGYYEKQIGALQIKGDLNRIRRMYCLQAVNQQDGKAVFPDFNRKFHLSPRVIDPVPYQDVVVGYDTSGIHPAACFMQEQLGRWCIMDELYGDNMSLPTFIETKLVPMAKGRYKFCNLIVANDPADPRNQHNLMTPSQYLRDYGFTVSRHKYSNALDPRIRAVYLMLNKIVGGLTVSPHCENIIAGFEGGYHYKKRPGSEDEYMPEPEKNFYSHYMDSVEYACSYVQCDETKENPLPAWMQRQVEHDRSVRRVLV